MTKRKKITMEFEIKSSPNILFNYISSPSGLSEWFANDVNVKDKTYTFFWDGEENSAEMLRKVNGKSVRFKWEDTDEEEYFEMEVKQDELTNDIAMVVTDYVNEDDFEETQMLWESQINDLRTAIGAF